MLITIILLSLVFLVVSSSASVVIIGKNTLRDFCVDEMRVIPQKNYEIYKFAVYRNIRKSTPLIVIPLMPISVCIMIIIYQMESNLTNCLAVFALLNIVISLNLVAVSMVLEVKVKSFEWAEVRPLLFTYILRVGWVVFGSFGIAMIAFNVCGFLVREYIDMNDPDDLDVLP